MRNSYFNFISVKVHFLLVLFSDGRLDVRFFTISLKETHFPILWSVFESRCLFSFLVVFIIFIYNHIYVFFFVCRNRKTKKGELRECSGILTNFIFNIVERSVNMRRLLYVEETVLLNFRDGVYPGVC